MVLLKLLIVDDHDFFRRSILLPLDTAGTIEVVGSVISGEQAVSLCLDLQPDVVLLDLNMFPLSGLAVLEQLTAQERSPAILVLTVRDDIESIVAAFAMGAQGYLCKDTLTDDLLLSAIFTVASGGIVMDTKTFALVNNRSFAPPPHHQAG